MPDAWRDAQRQREDNVFWIIALDDRRRSRRQRGARFISLHEGEPQHRSEISATNGISHEINGDVGISHAAANKECFRSVLG
jgi:hypothetical protein